MNDQRFIRFFLVGVLLGLHGIRAGAASLEEIRKDLHSDAVPFQLSSLNASGSLAIRSAMDLAFHYGGIRRPDPSGKDGASTTANDRRSENEYYRPSINDFVEILVVDNSRVQRFSVYQKLGPPLDGTHPGSEELALVYGIKPSVPEQPPSGTAAPAGTTAPAGRSEGDGPMFSVFAALYDALTNNPAGSRAVRPSVPMAASGKSNVYESVSAIFLPVGLLTSEGYPSAVYVAPSSGSDLPVRISDGRYAPSKTGFDGRRSALRWKEFKSRIVRALRSLPEFSGDKQSGPQIRLDLEVADREWLRPGDAGSAKVDYWMMTWNDSNTMAVPWSDSVQWKITSDGWIDFTASMLEPTEIMRQRFNTTISDFKLVQPDLNLAETFGKERIYWLRNSYQTLPQAQEVALEIARTFYKSPDDKKYNRFYFESCDPYMDRFLFTKHAILSEKESADNSGLWPARISLSRVSLITPERRTHFHFGKASQALDLPYRQGTVLRDVIMQGVQTVNDRPHARTAEELARPRVPSSCLCRWLGCDRVLIVVRPCQDWGASAGGGAQSQNQPFYLLLTPQLDYLLDEILVLPEDEIYCYR